MFFNTTATFLILLNTKQKQNHVADFVNELKSAHSKLQEAIAKTELSRQEECIHLLSRWGRQIADNPRGKFSIEEKSDDSHSCEV